MQLNASPLAPAREAALTPAHLKGVLTLVELTWLGHACFRLRGREATVITDPFGRSLGLSLGRQSADLVTVSHDSSNHSAAEAIVGQPRVVRGPGEYEVRGVMVAGVRTPGERGDDDARLPNTAYVITLDDLAICHLGDLGGTLNAEQIDALKDPDVLLVPAGGSCTISPAEAAEVISQLEPKLVVPMHFALPGLSVPLESLERFCREMGVEEIRAQPRLSVTRSSLPDETTVAILEAVSARR